MKKYYIDDAKSIPKFQFAVMFSKLNETLEREFEAYRTTESIFLHVPKRDEHGKLSEFIFSVNQEEFRFSQFDPEENDYLNHFLGFIEFERIVKAAKYLKKPSIYPRHHIKVMSIDSFTYFFPELFNLLKTEQTKKVKQFNEISANAITYLVSHVPSPEEWTGVQIIGVSSKDEFRKFEFKFTRRTFFFNEYINIKSDKEHSYWSNESNHEISSSIMSEKEKYKLIQIMLNE